MGRWSENFGLVAADADKMWLAQLAADRAGRPFAVALTFTPQRHLDDTARADEFSDMRSYLAREAKRKAGVKKLPQFWVREKPLIDPKDAGLHYHGSIPWFDGVVKIVKGLYPGLHVDPTGGKHGTGGWFNYMGKERSAEYEAALVKSGGARGRCPWEQPAPLIGSRYSMNGHLKDIVNAELERRKIFSLPSQQQPVEVAPQPVVVEIAAEASPLRLVADNAQPETLFELPPLPPSRPRSPPVVREKRKYARELRPAGQPELFALPDWQEWRELTEHLGETDAERARVVGVSRPQMTAIRNGLFGPSAAVAHRILALAS